MEAENKRGWILRILKKQQIIYKNLLGIKKN